MLIPYDHLGRALSGDTVTVEPFPDSNPDKPAGRVVSIEKRNDAPIVGRVQKSKGEWTIVAQGNRASSPLHLRDGELNINRAGLKAGDVVSARFLSWKENDVPRAALDSVIARKDDADAEIQLIALSRGLALDFPDEVTKAAASIKRPDPKSIGRKRRDIRNWTCITIDPERAKDFDDAISVEQLENGLFRIGVHIADVSAYVEPDDPVDKEAWERGTSVYLIDRVLPMLPEHLSNTVCSLVPDEPRFALSMVATVDSLGTVHDTEIFESLIESKRRFIYGEVDEILAGKSDPLGRELQLMQLLARTLRARREEQGSVDFDFSSREIETDENGVPIRIRPTQRHASNRLVEEFMLLANRLVAEHLAAEKKLPGLYRVHDQPPQSDLRKLIETLNDLGVPYKPDDPENLSADDYRAVLTIVENFEFKELVESIALKALPKAVYATANRGHFGLAMEAYTHFTSPIRRYPDLVVHRLVKRTLGRRTARGSSGLSSFLERTAEHATERERLATDAEREYDRLKALQFLSSRVGRTYSGVVTGVASVGLFVEIEKYLIDGMVPVATLGKEWFELDRASHRLIGKNGTEYRLGDRVQVTVVAVNTERRTAEFKLAGK
jgi:ribonuclease R